MPRRNCVTGLDWAVILVVSCEVQRIQSVNDAAAAGARVEEIPFSRTPASNRTGFSAREHCVPQHCYSWKQLKTAPSRGESDTSIANPCVEWWPEKTNNVSQQIWLAPFHLSDFRFPKEWFETTTTLLSSKSLKYLCVKIYLSRNCQLQTALKSFGHGMKTHHNRSRDLR